MIVYRSVGMTIHGQGLSWKAMNIGPQQKMMIP